MALISLELEIEVSEAEHVVETNRNVYTSTFGGAVYADVFHGLGVLAVQRMERELAGA